MVGRASFRIVLIAAVGLTVTGCAGLEAIRGKIEVIAPQFDDIVSKVTTFTKALCGFEPIAATLVGVVTAGASAAPLAIAHEVCDAVRAAPVAAAVGKRKIPVTILVRGVRIDGVVTPKKGR